MLQGGLLERIIWLCVNSYLSLPLFCFFFSGTALVAIYGRGYQINFTQGKPTISGTGIVVLTSIPDGAQVFVDDKLTTATNNTINLFPGSYQVTIAKEGYFPWNKKMTVQTEVVTKADALLLPTAPKLENVTNIGISNPLLDPSGTKIAYTVASQSADPKKNGVYVLNMNSTPILTLQSASTQLANDDVDTFSQSTLAWSPDGQNLTATINKSDGTSLTYLLSAGGFNQTPEDITINLAQTISQWKELQQEKATAQLNSLKEPLKQFATDNFTILKWSPDETKILYVASTSATIPTIINPPIIGADNTPENRTLEVGKVYVYDTKEDKNFKILDTKVTPNQNVPLSWLPDSNHLLSVHDKRIDIMEYDGMNRTTIFAGPFIDGFVFPWPDGKKVVILTNLGNDVSTPNLYTISLQ